MTDPIDQDAVRMNYRNAHSIMMELHARLLAMVVTTLADGKNPEAFTGAKLLRDVEENIELCDPGFGVPEPKAQQ